MKHAAVACWANNFVADYNHWHCSAIPIFHPCTSLVLRRRALARSVTMMTLRLCFFLSAISPSASMRRSGMRTCTDCVGGGGGASLRGRAIILIPLLFVDYISIYSLPLWIVLLISFVVLLYSMAYSQLMPQESNSQLCILCLCERRHLDMKLI